MKKMLVAAVAAMVAFAAGNANAQCIGCQQNAQPVFGATQSYAAPIQSYSAPVQSYSAPVQSYAAPMQSYSAPMQSYSAPMQSYSAPMQSYSMQSPNAELLSTNAELLSTNAVVRSCARLFRLMQLWWNGHTYVLGTDPKLRHGSTYHGWYHH